MGQIHTERVESLFQSNPAASEPGVKLVLTRLSAEIKDRFKRASPESFDFFYGALRSLSRLKDRRTSISG